MLILQLNTLYLIIKYLNKKNKTNNELQNQKLTHLMSSKDGVTEMRENILIYSLIFSSKKKHQPIKFQFFIMMSRERAITK